MKIPSVLLSILPSCLAAHSPLIYFSGLFCCIFLPQMKEKSIIISGVSLSVTYLHLGDHISPLIDCPVYKLLILFLWEVSHQSPPHSFFSLRNSVDPPSLWESELLFLLLLNTWWIPQGRCLRVFFQGRMWNWLFNSSGRDIFLGFFYPLTDMPPFFLVVVSSWLHLDLPFQGIPHFPGWDAEWMDVPLNFPHSPLAIRSVYTWYRYNLSLPQAGVQTQHAPGRSPGC